MTAFLTCLKSSSSSGNEQAKCRKQQKEYLECRMDKGLMERVGWDDLGLADVKTEKELRAERGER